MREVLCSVGCLWLATVAAATSAGSTLAGQPALARHSAGERLDLAHDWLYHRLQHWLERFDTHFAPPDGEPLLVPISPLRIGLDGELLHRADGTGFNARPELEASFQLPNIERRFRLFVSSTGLAESPDQPGPQGNPIRAGLRFLPQAHLNFDLGVRVRLQPTAFAALKWTPDVAIGRMQLYPLAKIYVESGLGLGASGGFSLERRTPEWIARSTSYADWLRNSASTRWAQSFVLGRARAMIRDGRYNQLGSGHDLACGALALVSVSGDRLSRTSAYEGGMLFKRPLHAGWLFGYVEPLVRWERDRAWHPDAGLRLGVDALFWGPASTPGELAIRCR